MSETEVYETLTEVFRDVFMRDIVVTPTLSAKDIAEWDSFRQIEIILASEAQFRVKFTTREVDSLKCVGDLVKFIVTKTESN